MAKCKRCGKWGFFLKLNSFGQCEKCEKELAEAARLERERKKAAFWEELNNLPHAEIRRDGVKQKAQPVSYLKEAMTYPRVTAKSNAAKFADFVVLDTETTGLSCTKDAVLEVAAIKVKSFKFVEVFHTMITPPPQKLSMDSAREAMSVNGITPEMLEGAPMLYQIIPSLQEFIGDMPLLGHNLEFDLKFLCRAGLNVTEPKRKFFDTYVMAGRSLKKPKWEYDKEIGAYAPNYDKNYDVENYKLETLCNYFGIDRMDAHRALGDCVDTAQLFRAFIEEKVEIYGAHF
jgi:DNA polymerase III epsilon subunit-like protein